MNPLGRQKYVTLLVAMVLLLVIQGFLPGFAGLRAARVIYIGLCVVVFLLGFPIIFTQPKLRPVAIVLAVCMLAGEGTGYAIQGYSRLGVALSLHGLSACFLGLAVLAVLHNILNATRVSTDTVCGAFCGYLLAGLAFGHLFCLIENVSPGSFGGSGDLATQLQDEEQQNALLTYFSFVTLTTVGYGDVTPTGSASRWLAVTEAILGQFYIAILLADLVGKRVAQVFTDRRA